MTILPVQTASEIWQLADKSSFTNNALLEWVQ